ncbi:Hypothetical predicted protein [Olea europaea subsp. europaea]|uniref:Uncharacterized protein n=1 Tax=Olea europaea subsp. europaea TaxID=158383 RepID=A0A8S0QMN7_OLEEU|nr:Hypothetical predicted protein [Olea europaea subsp. europaea]
MHAEALIAANLSVVVSDAHSSADCSSVVMTIRCCSDAWCSGVVGCAVRWCCVVWWGVQCGGVVLCGDRFSCFGVAILSCSEFGNGRNKFIVRKWNYGLDIPSVPMQRAAPDIADRRLLQPATTPIAAVNTTATKHLGTTGKYDRKHYQTTTQLPHSHQTCHQTPPSIDDVFILEPDILCPNSGEVIWTSVKLPNGEELRYRTNFIELRLIDTKKAWICTQTICLKRDLFIHIVFEI